MGPTLKVAVEPQLQKQLRAAFAAAALEKNAARRKKSKKGSNQDFIISDHSHSVVVEVVFVCGWLGLSLCVGGREACLCYRGGPGT